MNEETQEMKIARLAHVEAHAAITFVIEIAAQLIDAKIIAGDSFAREMNHAAAMLLQNAANEPLAEHARLVQELISRLVSALAAGARPTLH